MPDEMLAELARIQQGRNGADQQSGRREPEPAAARDTRSGGLQVARIATLAEFDETLGETLGARGATAVVAVPSGPRTSEPLDSLPTEAEAEPAPSNEPRPASARRTAASRITDELATLDPLEPSQSVPPPFVVDDTGLEGDPLAEDAFASATTEALDLDEPIDLGAFAARGRVAGAGDLSQRGGEDGFDTVDLPTDDDVEPEDALTGNHEAANEAEMEAYNEIGDVGLAEADGAEHDLAGTPSASSGGGTDPGTAGGPPVVEPGASVDAGVDGSTGHAPKPLPEAQSLAAVRPGAPPNDDPGATQPGLALSDIARRIREEARRSGEIEAAVEAGALDPGEGFDHAEVVERPIGLVQRMDQKPESLVEPEVEGAQPEAGVSPHGPEAPTAAHRSLPRVAAAPPDAAEAALESEAAPESEAALESEGHALGVGAPRPATASSSSRATLVDGLLPPRTGDGATTEGGATGLAGEAEGAQLAASRAVFDLADPAEATSSADELLESVDASFDDILDPPDPNELIEVGTEAAFDDLLDPGHALTIPPESVDEPSDEHGEAGGPGRARNAGTGPSDDQLAEALSALSHGEDRVPPAPRAAGTSGDSGEAAGDAPRAPRPPPIPSAGARYVLRVVSLGAGEGRLVELNGEPQVIGTAGSLRIEDAYASEQHARVAVEGARMRVDDLDSLNGVWLRLRASRVLQPGDRFLAGRQVLRLVRESGVSAPWAVGGVERLGARASSSGFRLQVLGADDSVLHDLRIAPDGCRIGRHLADLVFTDDDHLSATHAVVRPDGAGVRLDDLGSRNGTWVRVRGQLDLGVGDAFMTGRTVWRVSQPAR